MTDYYEKQIVNNADTVERCSRTGKRCLSYKVASGIAHKVRHSRQRGVNNAPIRCYKCCYCGWWHTTHRKDFGKNKFKEW